MNERHGSGRRQRAASGFVTAWRGWLLPSLVVVGLSLPLRAALADWYHVPSGSMRPTIIEGDRIFVNNLAFGLRVPLTRTWLARWRGPRRGDVVTLASPEDGKRLVKRVVAIGGDRVELRENRLVVNGRALAYSFAGESSIEVQGRRVRAVVAEEHLPGRAHLVCVIGSGGAVGSFPPMTVPEGRVFVMGDNRDMSRDSRFFGPVPVEHVYGRGSHVVLSLDPDRFYLPRLDRGFERLDR